MNQYVKIWSDEHAVALTSLIGEGFSSAESACLLNEIFGTTYSRNAIIGKAHRLKLSRKIKRAKKKYAAVEIQPKPAEKPRPSRYRPVGAPVFAPLACLAAECSEVIPLNLASPDGGCQYPYGEGPFVFCGRPRDGSSYCQGHHALTVGRMIKLSPADHQRRREHWMRLQKRSARTLMEIS